ncbi:MAG: pyruvate dehydrogenase (acetyl-transferring) E1 component subunit alpha [Chloroflexi bacterium]|nr:pyruvate dehydrogenase (acetyl-transferring) E1 component subunit alpha [Chloroflexota bacterium]
MDKDTMLDLYHEMVLVRRLEEAFETLYQEGKIGGFLHLYIGQEAVGSGVIGARQPQDRVITAYRDHGIAISCGIDPKSIVAELFGKEAGTSKGRGGSMHLGNTDLNFWGGHAIVGAHMPLATGMAMADKYRGSDAVTICLFGDGATNGGYFHEALNLSMVWDLPILWVCENNQYGMGTAVERASAVTEIRQKAEGYGMPNERVDGMDILKVYEATSKNLDLVRKNGPFFLELMTYRFRGHSIGDPERYREKEEIDMWRKDDPIGIFRKHLLSTNGLTDAVLDNIEAKAQSEIEEAIKFAEASADPSLDSLFDYVYVD